jgi:hypothetical protein
VNHPNRHIGTGRVFAGIQGHIRVMLQGGSLTRAHFFAEISHRVGAAMGAVGHLRQMLAALRPETGERPRIGRRGRLKGRAFHPHQRHDIYDLHTQTGHWEATGR